MDAKYIFNVLLTILFLSGCSAIDRKHKLSSRSSVSGTVTTGGSFARPQTVPIHEGGLSLGEVVEEVLRPTLLNTTAQQVAATPRPSIPTPGQNPSDARRLRALWEQHIVTPGIDGEFQGQNGRRIAREQVDKFLSNPLFAEISEPQLIEFRGDFVNFLQSITFIENEDQSENIEALQKRFGITAERLQSEVSVNIEVDSLFAKNVVILQRSSGQRIIAPLWLVRAFQVGDIALSDGDRVLVERFEKTSIGSRASTKDVNVIVTGLTTLPSLASTSDLLLLSNSATDVLASSADVIVLRTTGGLEKYIVPRKNAFGNNTAYDQFIANINLSSGDIVEFQNLDLLPEIRRGRILAVSSTASAIERHRRESVLPERVEDRRGNLQQFTVVTPASFRGLGARTRDALNVIPSSIGF